VKQRIQVRLLLFLTLLATNCCLSAETNPPAHRPSNWAQKIERPGLKNLHLITTNLYRGAQPTAEGMAQLKAMGIRTVINLRTLHSDKEEIAGTGLKSVRFTTQPWDSDNKDVIHFLQVVADTNNLPVFVHCQRGADRTGLMCAMYRVAVCGWTKPQAIEEMKEGGFDFSPLWKNILRYIEKADVEKLRRKAGILGGAAERPRK
jgi:protein tyrosine/serine phosphatase